MSFDRMAPHYRWMEAVLAGNVLQRCRTRWVADVPAPRRALLVGEGSGRMLEACARAWPGCGFTVLDSSAGMIGQARRRWHLLGAGPAADFIVADLREWPASHGAYDLVVTNFFLDCFAPGELEQVVSKLDVAAAPTATWLVSDFQVPRNGWRRIRARLVLALAYCFFRMATDISARHITAPDECLRSAGFVLRRREEFNFGLLHADLWQRLDSKPAGGTPSRPDEIQNGRRDPMAATASGQFSAKSG